jgi:catechol 2,3-dioxygenase-like lactoylglutathione lyase family enzyme
MPTMMPTSTWLRSSALGLALVATGWSETPQATGTGKAAPNHPPSLVNTCVITNNVNRLVEFYEAILQLKAKRASPDYAEFPTGVGVLAIFSADAQEKYIPHSAEAGNNKSVILEFRVDDVDEEYRRLQSVVKTWVKPPSTQPWGTRSIYFRDPDGNLVDLFALPNVR